MSPIVESYIDLQSLDQIADPFPLYKKVRSIDPVYWNGDKGLWYITGHPEMTEIFLDKRFSNRYQFEYKDHTINLSPKGKDLRRRVFAGGETLAVFAGGTSIAALDGPEHLAQRRALMPHFAGKEISRFRTIIERFVHELLDRMEGSEVVEFMREFAYELPVRVFNEMLGVPADQADAYINYEAHDLARRVKSGIGADEDYEMVAKQGDYYVELIDRLVAARSGCPATDIVTTLLTAQFNGCPLSKPDLYAQIYLLNLAGHSTTTALLGNVVYYLHKFDLWDRIREHQELLPKYIEEVLRFDQINSTGKLVEVDLDFHGHSMKKGDTVLLFPAAANRDPRVFNKPDEFIHDRTPNPHITFGLGSHFCIGAPFARLEAELAMKALFRRFPNLKLESEPTHSHCIGFGFEKLAIRPNG